MSHPSVTKHHHNHNHTTQAIAADDGGGKTYFSRYDKKSALTIQTMEILATQSTVQDRHDGQPQRQHDRSCEPHSGWRGAQTHLLGVRHCEELADLFVVCEVGESKRLLIGEGVSRRGECAREKNRGGGRIVKIGDERCVFE